MVRCRRRRPFYPRQRAEREVQQSRALHTVRPRFHLRLPSAAKRVTPFNALCQQTRRAARIRFDPGQEGGARSAAYCLADYLESYLWDFHLRFQMKARQAISSAKYQQRLMFERLWTTRAQARDALKPSHASTAATMQAIQLAQTGIETPNPRPLTLVRTDRDRQSAALASALVTR
jgi:hypothetical protein